MPARLTYTVWLVGAFIMMCSFNLFLFWRLGAESLPGIVDHGQNVALVYAGQSFHDEVTASMSCMLHLLGYTVIVYIENGVVLGDFVLPFTEKRKHTSTGFYGHCVSRWITIKPSMLVPDNPKLLMFITYPMNHKDLTIDENSYKVLRQLTKASNSLTKLLLVTHRAPNFWQLSGEIFKYVPPNKVTFLFLAEHTYKTAVRHLQATCAKNATCMATYNMRIVYPILSLPGDGNFADSTALHEHDASFNKQHISFAIQGNLGGKHGKRRNLNGTVQCLQGMSQVQDFWRPRDGNASTPALQLSLVGRIDGPLPMSTNQRGITVRVFQDLSPRAYYNQLSRAGFIVTSLGSNVYTYAQATSTIPAALAANVPIVSTRAFLQLYPCLRDAPMHKHINVADECASMKVAASLSAHNYTLAKREVRNCSRVLWETSVDTLRTILQ